MKLQTITCPSCHYSLSDAKFTTNQLFSCPACQTTLVLTDLATDDRIICPDCKTINPDSQRFCDRCGTKLNTGCPFCYAQNSIDAEHCNNCGANLQRARQRKQSWLSEQRSHAAHRREALQQAEAEQRTQQIQKLLEDLDEPENHPMAIYCLHQLGAEAVESLVAHLSDDDPDARFGAAQTLGLIGDSRAVPGLIQALDDAEPVVRYWAADALGKLKAEAAIEPLGKCLRDNHKGVRDHAEEVLQQIGTPQSTELLQKHKRKWWRF